MPYGAAVAYASVTAETASPQRLLTMLYDRLITDLSVAEAAMRTNEHETVGRRLQHAQEILLELWASLDTEIWPAGEQLKALYLWLVNELVNCRLPAEVEQRVACRELVEPVGDGWKQAMEAAARQPLPDLPVNGAA